VETGARPHLHGLATADFNGDGWPDVAVDSTDTGQVWSMVVRLALWSLLR
jgi:hypothetical protein